MKGVNAAVGWLLMLVVLAVPSVLFYNWWTKNKAPAAEAAPAAVSQEAFPNREAAPDSLVPVPRNAAASAAPAAASNEPAPQPQLKQASLVPGPAVQDLPGKPANLVPGTPQQAAAPLPAAPAAPEAKAKQPAGSGYNPKSVRNPMLSVEDFKRIQDEQAARAEEARQARMGTVKRRAEPDVAARLRLQGIVGNAAIINGEMYYQGQTIYGAKLIKVGADYILLEHKGKKIRKAMQ